MNRSALFIVVLAAVFVLIFFFSAKKTNEGTPLPSPTPTSTPANPSGIIEQDVISVAITDTGFVPEELFIKIGDTVVFINEGTRPRWPASDIHPTHQLYPGSGLIKCGTSEEDSIFDSCRGIQPGETWSFTFYETGTWFYHDHLRPSISGKIIVQ